MQASTGSNSPLHFHTHSSKRTPFSAKTMRGDHKLDADFVPGTDEEGLIEIRVKALVVDAHIKVHNVPLLECR